MTVMITTTTGSTSVTVSVTTDDADFFSSTHPHDRRMVACQLAMYVAGLRDGLPENPEK